MYFFEYTRIEVETFQNILIQDLDSIEKTILHRSNYDQRVNEQKLQIQEEHVHKVDSLKASLVVMDSNGTESEVQDGNSRLGNDTNVDCAEIRPFYDSEPNFDKGQMDEEDVIPIYDKEPNFEKEQMIEVQSTIVHIMPANEKQQSEQPNFSNE